MYKSTNLQLGYYILSKLKTLLFLIVISTGIISAQSKGSISGRVMDASNNEVLIGANIIVVGTNTGTSSDLDGYYAIKGLEPGTYSIKFSFVSYQATTVQNVKVEAGKDTKLNIQLKPTSTEINEVVVTAEALKSTEGAILNIQKNSMNIVDGLSAELISKNNSSDGTDVLKRMTGVTISEGKYAFIRGVGDRYNNTMLNGANLPSTDPEKKSFAYDLFPASLIENVLTSKTFIPDKPADFTGGLVEINTIEFPSKFIFDISASSAFNTRSTFKNFSTYSGGSKDFIGFDDGTREIPSLIPAKRLDRTFSPSELQSYGLAFKNNWQTSFSKAPVNSSFKINLGNQLALGNDILGYIGSLTYSNSFELKELEQANYTYEGPRYQYQGTNSIASIAWGALFNLSYKSGRNHKISLKNVYNQNADDETTTYEGSYTSYLQHRKVTSLKYVSRSLYSTQLIGNHHFNLLNGINFEWNLSYAISKRDEPDARRYIYARDYFDENEPLRLLLDQSLFTRYFGNLTDNNYSAQFNFTIKPFENPNLPSFKLGYLLDKKDRAFNARIFGFRNIPGGNFLEEDKILQQSIDKIFAPQNINPTFIEITEITQPTDSYSAEQNINAAYLMMDFQPIDKIKIVTGLRYENSVQKLNSKSRTGEPIDVNAQYNDIFPSINITYQPSETINLRFAASRTLARPEFREIAPFTYFDFVSNELVMGNTKLKRSLISNYDIRFEFYPAPKELISISGFYKKFLDPIEQILISSSALEPIRSYENAMKANNYGVEFEIRKELEFISPLLNNFAVVGNLSLIKSKIELENRGFQISERPLQGQADFILNLGIYYEDYSGSLSASLIYNKVGERIAKVGFGGLGDVVELPRDQIDFSLSTKIYSGLSLKVAARDILAQDIKFIQKTPDGDKPSEIGKRGQTFSVGFSYSL
ncbi:MAG: TonB-dependent receptor [Melioribacter sp.]|nr:TonB-dependent receptor [Melioribacter sp.]